MAIHPFVDCRTVDLSLKKDAEFNIKLCWLEGYSVNANMSGNRPLSPHIQVYRPLINMVMSIFHRISGAVLYFGMFFLAWWLISVATNAKYFEFVHGLLASAAGRLVLFVFTWSLMHHALGGIRHFIWDTGRGYGLGTVNLLSWATILGSTVLTFLFWTIGYAMLGAF